MAKFNKTNIIANLKARINIIVTTYKFDLSNGYAQLKHGEDHLQRNIAYGELKQCQRLLIQIEDGSI